MMDWHAKRESITELHEDRRFATFMPIFYRELNECYNLRDEAEMLFHAHKARTDQRGTT